MITTGEFLEELKEKGNFSGNYALQKMEELAPPDRWEETLRAEMTPETADALLDAVKSWLVEVEGYYETDEGRQMISEENNSFISDFGAIALQHGIELPSQNP